MSRRHILQERVHLIAFVVIALLAAISLISQRNADWYSGDDFYRLQVVWYIIGGVIFVIAAMIDLRMVERLSLGFYGVCVLGLVFTALVGTEVNNSQRWLRFAGLNFQFSELTKLGVVLEGMHELTRDFVFLLLERNREEVLVSLGDAFKRRSLAEEGAVEGTVESARELPQDEVEAVATALGERLGKRVRLDSRTNPDLVAGVRVFVGTSMIDLSVQGRLEGLRRQLIEAPLPVPGS